RILDGRPVSPVIPEIVSSSSGTNPEQGQLVRIEVPAGAYAYKVVLGGEGGVGKTSLVHSFVEGKFEADYKATIGTSIMKKEFSLRGSDTTVRFIIWDLAGQDQFKRVRQQYFREAEAGVMVFDVTRRETFEAIERWVSEARQGGKEGIKLILVGNKMDIPERQVTFEEGAEMGKRLGLSYIETSAKTGEMVSDAFEMLALTLFRGLTATTL
ncbi:MAG TPA: Rab family GTPase, partial [Candidatus Lokiarchaeia archaeon]|nr:Rab family GTPase [Candidatus Lokiarchaeia archaeon]